MTDELNEFKPLDPGRIDNLDLLELQYWSRALNCTEAELKHAVSQVGTHVTAVRDFLATQR